MTTMFPIPPPGFDQLSVDEQIHFVESLWDRIAVHAERVPVPDWHRHVLAERLAAYESDPDAGKPWEEVRDELQRELRDIDRRK
ncbi:MAG TPA: addiction module protein [Blastocatellia bacterium]|nr:addiction module protein [Blastocatellia bacterium]